MLSAELNVRRMEYRVSKKISGELHFDADPATVYTMVSDQAYVQEKNERTGGQNVEAEVTDNGAEGCKIVVSRDLPAEIPAFAKKFVGEKISTVQTDEWGPANDDGSYSAKFHVDFGKAPMVIDGTMKIDAEGGGSVLRVDAEVKASVPFVGGKLEGVAAEQFDRAVRKEQEVGAEWLTR